MPALLAAVGVAALLGRSVEGPEARPEGPQCTVAALSGVRGQLLRAIRDSEERRASVRASTRTALAPAPAADFSLVAHAVLVERRDGADSLIRSVVESPAAAVDAPTSPLVPCGASVRRRDDVVWRMALSGFSAREIADVVSGHLSLGTVRQARARLMAGHPRADVAAFLESAWREAPEDAAAPQPSWPSFSDLEPDVQHLAAQHGLSPALVRAVVAAESAGNPRALSPKGAIGLMQLMPATAAALGVDPWQPRENLRGGVAYLAGLLRDFGSNLRLALIAYNAGPQHARAVQAGRAVAYRETRAYVDAIRKRYPFP
jgi:hypothetical protein